MITILKTVEILANVMIIALIMKMTISAREFFFSPLLRPIDIITEPYLKHLRKIFRPTQTGWDYSPFVGIGLLLIIHAIVIFLTFEPNAVAAVVLSFLSSLGFFLQVVTICFIVAMMISPYIQNPLAKFLSSILYPFEKLFAFPFHEKNKKLIAAYVGCIVISIMIFQVGESVYHQVMAGAPGPATILQNMNSRTHFAFDQVMFSGKVWLLSFLSVLTIIVKSLKFISFIILVSALLSWVNLDSRNPVMQFVYSISEPIITPIRRTIPSVGGLDLSPMFGMIAIWIIMRIIMQLILTIQGKVVGV